MIRFVFPFFVFMLFTWGALAQTTLNREPEHSLFQEALTLLNRNNYSAARAKFEEYIQTDPTYEMMAEARYYQAYSAMHLFNEDAEKLYKNFVNDYPTHPKAMLAYFELGNFYFRNKEYERAIESFNQVNVTNLSNAQRNELRYKLGYSYFAEKNFDEALNNLKYPLENKNTYQGASAYYSAYIALENEQYEDAVRFLDIAGEYEAYERVVPFLKTKALYGQGKYNDVIAYARPMLVSDKPVNEKNDLTIMVAESFYFLDDFRNAFVYYEEGIEPGGNRPPELLLRAGLSAFQSGYFEKAVEYLKNAALADGETGQYASYYLGLAYIRVENKNYAITAFENAVRKEFSNEITDESRFYLGKLYFETGRYADAIDVLQPLGKSSLAPSHREEINELISQAYLSTDDVNMAIEYIESLPERTSSVNRVYQIVTFKKAVQLFNAGDFRESVDMFRKSLEYPVEKDLVLKSWFWTGEAYSIGRMYEDAIRSYLEVFRNDPSGRSETVLKTRYGLGYAYFNIKSYEKALEQFRVYIREIQRDNQQFFYNDALLRLADCYYVTRDYREAIATYEKAIQAGTPEPDYAYYQTGVIQSILGNRQLAEQNLNRVVDEYGQSVHLDDALFQRAQVAFENGDYTTAIARYTNLINDQSQSPYIPYALVDRGISNYNLKNYEATISDYQRVLNEFPRHQEANDALLGLQEVLNITGRSDQFNSYLSRYKAANPEDKALASVEFESAKSYYFNQQYEEAIRAFREYLSAYPDSPFTEDVNYYLGESYYRSEDFRSAIEQLLPVTRNTNSEWNSRAVSRVAMLYSELDEPSRARDFYRRLERIATNRRTEFDAHAGLMEAYFKLQKYDSAIYFGEQILSKGAFSVNAENRAQLLVGKSYLASGNVDEAMDYFLNTVNTAKDIHAAEAQYRIAEIYHNQEEYQPSNEALYNLNENFGNYEEWIGRSFLLIADNFMAMDEIFQAKATLNSLIENSPVEPVVEEARKKLELIEQEEERKAEQVAGETDELDPGDPGEQVPVESDTVEIN